MNVIARALAVVIMALSLSGCALVEWTADRLGCGFKCPKNSSCKPISSGVFGGASGCVCDGPYDGVSLYPYKGHDCPAPSPSPKASK